jgi:hypothetical protein
VTAVSWRGRLFVVMVGMLSRSWMEQEDGRLTEAVSFQVKISGYPRARFLDAGGQQLLTWEYAAEIVLGTRSKTACQVRWKFLQMQSSQQWNHKCTIQRT